MLAATRSRRPNAGNRMQALLAAQDAFQEEEAFATVVNDAEYEAGADEADVFASDFASTDSEPEADPSAIAATEAALRREERATRHPRRFHDPLTAVKRSAPPKPGTRSAASQSRAKRRRTDTNDLSTEAALQPSRNVRTSTVLAHLDTASRVRSARALALKRAPALPREHVEMSQSERIEAALKLEGTNREELADWLEKEEERRQSVAVRKRRVEGPRTMWISRTVEGTAMRYERNLLNLAEVKPQDELSVILGTHATWSALPVIPSTATREPLKCAITGLPARYKDPITGIPYANLAAYTKLQRLAAGDREWRWSAQRRTWLSGVRTGDVAVRSVVEDDAMRTDVAGWRQGMLGHA
ncbi:hypothetical protein NliqN6_4049 [Naganishia liquefaciens]|uniref:Vps72/YL1 C-terminal domain-containing protein n=1 Tax=Naganishia liquefaciens TaxID=104408 RepID=A0A8H3TUZ4_9TREE|nr:hypothetical protein NliqN6_4049 [Naganishia liquefaciens]